MIRIKALISLTRILLQGCLKIDFLIISLSLALVRQIALHQIIQLNQLHSSHPYLVVVLMVNLAWEEVTLAIKMGNPNLQLCNLV